MKTCGYRRPLGPLIFSGICALAAFALCARARSASPDRPPNFIVIFCDDLGYGDIGPFGAKGISTPNLDRMAAEGARLTSFYASASVCTPSRAGLMTGRYATRMGLGVNVLMPGSKNGLPQSETTLPEILKTRGYHTAMVGKWHLGVIPEHAPAKHGFDEFLGLPYSNDMNPLALYRGEEKLPEQPVDQDTLTQRYTAEALRVIEAHAGPDAAPFFLYLAHNMPHVPLHASKAFRGRSKAGLYGDVVEEIDWSVGEILKKLDALHLSSNTLVLFTSDNGPWHEGSPGPHRGRKGDNWEGGQREPTLARWTDHIPAGEEIDAVMSALDVTPTFAALAGAALPAGVKLDGADVSHLITGASEPAGFADRPFFYFQNDDIAAVRSGPWKFVVLGYYRTMSVSYDKRDYTNPGLLFHLENDPQERYSLAAENPAVVKRLQGEIERMRADLAASRPSGAPNAAAPEAKANE